MPWSFCPWIRRGAQPLSRILVISAPIRVNGSMIRFMGRLWMDSSPFNSVVNLWPARMPEISRVVVPLFPTSSIEEGAVRPWRPFPWIRISESRSSMSIPSFRKQSIVDRQSAPRRKLVTLVVPSASAPNIIERWEMLLSPGTVISPFNALVLVNII